MTEADLKRAIEENRKRTETAIADLGMLRVELDGLKENLREKHEQNRRDIHTLRNSIQALMDEFYKFCKSITETLHHMQLTSARAKGYWLGVGAAVTFMFEIIKIAIEHYVK